MESDSRPNPDQLLAQIAADEQRQQRGKLKVFLGYAAGVGKTYAMLEAAHQRRRQGVDVLVGYVETHGRDETDALLAGLEVLPRRQNLYRGVSLSEMDLDGILARRPQLVLVDELAHTNADGSRHAKRYQDVEELLSAGINVFSTVNVQHLESLNDVIQQITGVRVNETIPDRLMDEADEIEVVDLPPDELIQRLKEGKVYLPEQAARAIQKFFRKGNLTALREISLRRAAEQVDDQMRAYMREKAIAGPWAAGDRILVCLSSHPLGERLIRIGRRLADDLNAEWTVAFVETPGHLHMPPENRLRIQRNLILAEQLGARIENLSGTSVAETVLTYAHKNNITKIVAGKPLRPRWYELLRGRSVVDQVIHESGNIDVYVVSETVEEPVKLPPASRLVHRHWERYLLSILLVALVTLFNAFIYSVLEPINLVMFFLAAVVISAVWLGRGPSILASLLSVLAFDFFFVHPRYSFAVSDTEYILTFIALMTVGLIISSSASLLRDQVDQLRRREANERAINSLSKELTAARDLVTVLSVVVRTVEQTFQLQVVILLPDGDTVISQATSNGLTLDANELAVAQWSFHNSQPAGRGTETLASASIRIVPLKTAHGKVGVLGIKPRDDVKLLTLDERLLLDNFANLAALAIERAQFAEQASQAEALRSSERLQSALLNSISHELRTPLSSILGGLTSLEADEQVGQNERTLDQATRLELIQSATSQARQLNRLVGNLLDMTRLQAGAVRLNREATDLQDLVGAVVAQVEDRLSGRQIIVSVPEDLPQLRVDAVLIGQALLNILDNAIKFSPSDSQISVGVAVKASAVEFAVQDQGPGIPGNDLQRVFDKFYRGSAAATTAGTGLGLAICRGIIEAHGGRIWAENVPAGGLRMMFSIPLEKVPER